MPPHTNGAPMAPIADGVRDARGRFRPGNPGGPGNPRAARVERLRSALLDATEPDDVARVWRALMREAEAGNVAAAREVLDRVLGKAAPALPEGESGARGVVFAKVIVGMDESAL